MREKGRREIQGREEQVFLVGADGRRDVGTVLLIQRVIDNRAVFQGHLGLEKKHTNHCTDFTGPAI